MPRTTKTANTTMLTPSRDIFLTDLFQSQSKPIKMNSCTTMVVSLPQMPAEERDLTTPSLLSVGEMTELWTTSLSETPGETNGEKKVTSEWKSPRTMELVVF